MHTEQSGKMGTDQLLHLDVFRLWAAVSTLVFLSGCATGIFLPRVGNRTDQIARFEQGRSNADELILYYRVNTYAGSLSIGGRKVASDIPKWSRLDLQTVKWKPLVWRGISSSVESQLIIEDGPRPVPDPSYKEVPILTFPAEYRLQNEAYVKYLVSAALPYRLSIHTYYDRDGPAYSYLILVRNGKDDAGQLYNDSVRPPMREYRAWWAIPARIALAPVAVTTDLLLSPFYIACLVFHCHM